MWIKKFSKLYPGIKKEAVWNIWGDVNNWSSWDEDLEYCRLETSFAADNEFILKPKGGPKVKIILSEVVPYKKFTTICKFLGATMYDIHELEEMTDGLQVSHTVLVTGPLRFIWIHLVAKKVAASVPHQTENLIALARRHG